MRRLLVVVVALLAVLVTTVGVTAVWARNQVLDTDRYLRSVTPLASDPVIQDELADKVADAITTRIEEAAPTLTGVGPVVSGQAHAFMESEEFAAAWVALNRQGHRQLVRLLDDEDAELRLDLGDLVEEVRALVADAGLTIVTSIPPITLVVELADVRGIDQARSAVRVLDRVADVLPVLALALVALAVWLARRRLRAGAWLAGGIAAGALVMVGLVLLGASVAAAQVPERVASEAAVHAYYGHLTALLRDGYLAVAVVGAVAAAGCASLAKWRSGSPAR